MLILQKYLSLLFLFIFLIINNSAYANKFKIKDLEIDLFDKNKQIKSSKAIREGFGKVEVKVFAEKVDEDNLGPIILIVYAKINKSGAAIRNFFLDYFFNFDDAIFQKEDAYHYIVDKKKINALQIKEFNLEKFVKRSDDFIEIRSALKSLYKKNSLKLDDTVIKSDHLYSKSNGDLVWVSYMFNYKTKIKEDFFQNGKSKFHIENINEFPLFKNYMDKWSNLAFKRHDEFQTKLKIKSMLDLLSENFNNEKKLSDYEDIFYSVNINDLKKKNENENLKSKEKESKAKEEKEKKAKLAAEQKAKEEKAKKAAKQESAIEDNLSVEDIMTKIKDLNDMYKSGLISKEEFELLKSKLLKNN